MSSERTAGDGYDRDGGGDGGGGESDAAGDGREGGTGRGGGLKGGERDIVKGHPEEGECQEAISLLSAGVMPLLLHPMLNTC